MPGDVAGEVQRVLLNRLRVGATGRIGPQMLADADVEVIADALYGDLTVMLTSFLLVHERMTSSEDVYYETTAPYAIDVETPRSWWQEHKPTWWASWFRRKYKTVHTAGRLPVCGLVRMQRKVYDAFPDNAHVFPPEFGRAIVFETFGQARESAW